MKQEYRIRGHHIVDFADYLYDPDKVRQNYLERGYGEDFVNNQAHIVESFISGQSRIIVVAGCLDDFCLGNCLKMILTKKNGKIPCNDPVGIEIDTKSAGRFFLTIGETYSFEEIEKNLRNFYLDQHSM